MPPAGPLTRADGNAPRAGAHPRVRHWLNKAGLAHYWDRLSSLTEPEFGALGMVDYAALGIVDSADKQKLFRLIKNLNAEGAFKTDAVDATPAHPAPAPPARRGVSAEVVHDPGPADDAKKPKSPIGSSDAIGEGEGGAGDLRGGDPSSPLEEDALPPVVDPRVTAFDLDHARRASSSGVGGSDPIRNDRHVAAFESAGSHSPLADDALLTEAAGLGADLMEKNQTDGNHRGDLMDVDDGEEEEFLLSPVAARRGLSATFAPSPTRVGSGGGGDDRDDGGSRRESCARARRGGSSSPLDQLHELSLERAAPRRADPSTADATRGGHDDDAPGEVRHRHPPPLAPPPADQPRIRVVVRKRPLNKKERASDQEDVVTVDRGPPSPVAPADRSADDASPERSGAVENATYARASASLTVWEPKTKVDLTKYTESHVFAFDDVFPEDASNDEVYRTTVKPLLGSIFDKCKVTCFAYGQTGSGKTYTMSPLPTRAAGEILGELARRDDDVQSGGSRGGPDAHQSLSLHVSFFEIYGGKVYDLLNGRRKLVIREDARNQMCVVGLQEFEVDTVDLVERLIEHGTAARCVGSTGANAESSRSHAIMQFALKAKQSEEDLHSATNGSSALGGAGPNGGRNLHVPASVLAQRREKAAGGANCHAIVHGKFSFIDLAGSERGADTSENDRQTRIEGAEINKSLLALKECIRALDRGSGHVPFRGSKLTEVLRDSFMGDSRTVMIANVSPATGSCEHTLNTLRYAYRVKELRSEGGEREGGRATNAGGGSHRDATETLGERALEAARAEKEAAAQREAGAKKGGGTLGRARPQTARPRLQAAAEAAPEKAREPTTSNSARDARRAAAQRVAVRRSAEDAGGGGLMSPRKRGFRDAEKDRAQAAAISQTRRGEKKADAREAKADAAFGSKADAGGLVKDPRWAARADPRPSRPKSALPRASSSSAEASSRAAAANPAAGTNGPPRTPERASAKAARALLGAEAGDDRDDEKAPPFSEGAFAPVSAAVDPAVPPGGASPPHPLPSSSSFARALAAATGSGPPVPASEMAAAHDDLINVILEEEEHVVSAHRAQIERAMELVKKEMGLLAEVDKPGSAIDVYVERLAEVLERKAASIAELAAKVKTFRAHLRQEETLSKAVGLH